MSAAQARLVIIADDLTGALDTAAPFAQRGLHTRVLAFSTAGQTAALRAAQVIAINTESRHLPPVEAAAAVERAVREHVRAGDVLLKKIDSTLRGNVATETLAAAHASGRHAVIFAPAFPAQGRTLREGIVYVHGTPLAQTEFARDALSPAPREAPAQLLQLAAPGFRVEHVRAQDWRAQARGAARIAVVDAQSQEELELLAARARPSLSAHLLVGSAGLSSALAATLAPLRASAPAAAEQRQPAQCLFVVGSRSEKTRAQAAALRAAPNVLTLEAPNGVASLAELEHAVGRAQANTHLMLLATQAQESQPAPAHIVAQRLALLTLTLLQRAKVSAVIASGGDTATAILQCAQNPVVQVIDELMPGVALARFAYNSLEYLFVTKAGGFGKEDTLISIEEVLGGSGLRQVR